MQPITTTPQQRLIEGVHGVQPRWMQEALDHGADPFLVDPETGKSPFQWWGEQIKDGLYEPFLQQMGSLLLSGSPRPGHGEVAQIGAVLQEEMKSLAFALGAWDQAQAMGVSSPEYGRIGRPVRSIQETFAVVRDAWVQREGREPTFDPQDFAVAFARGASEARSLLEVDAPDKVKLRMRYEHIYPQEAPYDPAEARNLDTSLRAHVSEREGGFTVLASGALAAVDANGFTPARAPVAAAALTGVIKPTEDHVVNRNIGINAQQFLGVDPRSVLMASEGQAISALNAVRQARTEAALETAFGGPRVEVNRQASHSR